MALLDFFTKKVVDFGKAIGGDIARSFLRKKDEKEDEEPTRLGTSTAFARTTTPTTAIDIKKEQAHLSPKNYDDEVRQFVVAQVQSGVVDKDAIKNNTKSFIKRRVNEAILTKVSEAEAVRKTIPGFVSNFKEDVREIVQGIGVIGGMTLKKLKSPIKSSKELGTFAYSMYASPQARDDFGAKYISPIIDEYKEYRHPLTKLYEDPLDVLLDATAIMSGAGKLVQTAGKVAVKTGAKGVGKGLITVGTKVSGASRFAAFKNISKVTKKVLNKFPPTKQLVKYMDDVADGRKLVQKEAIEQLSQRNRAFNEINKRVNKLSKEEAAILPRVAEGFVAPKNLSKEFYETMGLMRSMAEDNARFGLKTKAFTDDILLRRQFQPLQKWLEREGMIKPGAVPYEALSGSALRGQIDTIKKFFPEANPIYMRHFFEDAPKGFSDFFLNTKPVKSFKPGSLKKSYGKAGYIGDSTDVTKLQLKQVLTKQAAENIKWQKNIDLIEKLKGAPTTKAYRAGDALLPGHKVFAPDGMLRFYRGSIDLAEELKKGLAATDNVWENFDDAVKAVFPKTKEYLGATKNVKMFQVPEGTARAISQMAKSTNPYIKLFWDKPLDAFRFSVLGLYPRWQFNNVIGNAMFSIINGDVLNPKAFYYYRQAQKGGMFPDELFGGVHQIERTTSGKIGNAASNIPWVKSTMDIHDALLNTKAIGPVVRNAEKAVKAGVFKPIQAVGNAAFKANQYVDDLFKGSAYINEALRAQRKGFIKRALSSFDDVEQALKKVKLSAKATDDMVKKVHEWYYHGLNMTDFERRVVRRVVPFYSWMRWSTGYAVRIATEAPVRAGIIRNLARDFYTFTGQNKLPDWMRGSVPIGNDEDGTVYYLKTQGLNPFSHINDLMSDGIIGTAIQSSAPGIKTAIEQTTGEELFLGKQFTKEGLTQAFNGQLYKFDPELGETVEVDEKIKPGLIENLLRNYLPQYLLMETALTGGKQRYTAEGLDTILSDLFKDEKDRKAVVKDVITMQGKEKTSLLKEVGKAVGINIQEVSPSSVVAREKALQSATTAILNKELPLLNPQFKNLLKERIMKEVASGTTKEELEENIKIWIGNNVEELKKLK